MKFKIVQPSDWLEYKSIRLQSLKDSPQAFGASFEKESSQSEELWKEKLTDTLRLFAFAYDEQNISGIVGAIKIKDNIWNIIAMYMAPEQRGQKHSGNLLDFLLQQLTNQAAAKACLRVNVEQKAAIQLYKSCGFQITETLKNELLGDGLLHDEYVMEKNL